MTKVDWTHSENMGAESRFSKGSSSTANVLDQNMAWMTADSNLKKER